MMKLSFVLSGLVFLLFCSSEPNQSIPNKKLLNASGEILLGNTDTSQYLPLLKEKKTALVANQTSVVFDKHLLDFLVEKKIKILKVFAPEHGFRGNSERGEEFDKSIDSKTKIPIFPLFGKTKKMKPEDISDVDIVVFDIQDVGARFFTYISTLHYVMEACAKSGKMLILLDRPNPLGDYVAGPVLKKDCQSFVGVDPIPIVHGLTIGELAQMINGENMLGANLKCKLKIIKVRNYNHKSFWSPPIKPSPNLPDIKSIKLYPSLCLFEATKVSIGRGTEFPFQVIGYPDSSLGKFSFIPKSVQGAESKPLHENIPCFGFDLRKEAENHRFTLRYICELRDKLKDKQIINNENWLNLLIGDKNISTRIIRGDSYEEIEKLWENDLAQYKKTRKKYLLYEDFE